MHLFKFLSVALLLGCSSSGDTLPLPGISGAGYVMRWDHHPEAALWTDAAMQAVMATALPDVVPADMAAWCPAYMGNDADQRAAFWVGLLSAIAKHESTWNPQAVGGGGQWFGLMQISPATARGYGCAASSGAALQDGAENLRCAIAIIGQTVPRDGVVAAGRGGVAADWGPFRNDAKRADMRGWVSQQSYCR